MAKIATETGNCNGFARASHSVAPIANSKHMHLYNINLQLKVMKKLIHVTELRYHANNFEILYLVTYLFLILCMCYLN